jgi:hypothetical protein
MYLPHAFLIFALSRDSTFKNLKNHAMPQYKKVRRGPLLVQPPYYLECGPEIDLPTNLIPPCPLTWMPDEEELTTLHLQHMSAP